VGAGIPVDQDEGNGETTVFVFLWCVSQHGKSSGDGDVQVDARGSHISVRSPVILNDAIRSAPTTTPPRADVPSAISSNDPSNSSSTTIVKLFLSIFTTSAASPLNRLNLNLRIASFVVVGRSTEFVDCEEGQWVRGEGGGSLPL
jgi:hypothetical protein